MKQKLLVGAMLVGSTILGACGGYGGGYYARSAPPAPRYGVVGVAPGPGFVWTDGYWGYRGNNYYWNDGRWVRPPRRGAVWVRPEWRNERGRYRFHRGYWR
jgi:hypothetical protein